MTRRVWILALAAWVAPDALLRPALLEGAARAGVTEDQVAVIRSFLESLTGTVDAAYVARPELPESGPKTPKPDPS